MDHQPGLSHTGKHLLSERGITLDRQPNETAATSRPRATQPVNKFAIPLLEQSQLVKQHVVKPAGMAGASVRAQDVHPPGVASDVPRRLHTGQPVSPD